MLGSKIYFIKKCRVQKFILSRNVRLKNLFHQEMLGSKIYFIKKCWVQKFILWRNVGFKNLFYQEILGSKIYFIKKCWVQTFRCWFHPNVVTPRLNLLIYTKNNSLKNFNFHFEENTICPRYKHELINIVQGNNGCYQNHKQHYIEGWFSNVKFISLHVVSLCKSFKIVSLGLPVLLCLLQCAKQSDTHTWRRYGRAETRSEGSKKSPTKGKVQ